MNVKSDAFVPMRVGALASATGVSVRTLHYYDEIGLLQPSIRTDGRHRLYSAEDIARLQRILSIRALGFSLEEIAECLGNDADFSPRAVIELHITSLTERIDEQRTLRDRLRAIATRLDRAEDISPDEFIKLIEAITMTDKYFNEEQRAELDQRASELGSEGLRAAESQWTELMARVRAEMDAGTDPKHPRVQALATQWMELVNAFTGGNPEIAKNLERMYREEKSVAGQNTAEQREMMEYVGRAIA